MSMFVLVALALAQAPGAAAPADAERIVRDCNAHKFDTVVSAEVDGKMQSKRLRLCGEVGQSDSEWLKTLEDSIAKIEAGAAIAKPMREAMATSLKVEILRLRGATPSGQGVDVANAPPTATEPPTGEITLKPRAAVKSSSGLAGYNSLPPLPDPVVVKAKEAAAFVPPPPIVRPSLNVQCFTNGAIAEGPCDEMDRHGLVVVRSKDAVGPGVALHFLLDGQDRDAIELSGMRKGQRRNLTIPSEVCRGTSGGRLEMVLMVTPAGGKFPPQRAESFGPADLRCS